MLVAMAKSADAATSGLKMTLVIDRREHELFHLLKQCLSPRVASLPVGDVVCSHGDNPVWVIERKTAGDLAKSLTDGRWADQTARLLNAGYPFVFFVIEGDLSATNLPHASLLGAYVNAELREHSTCFRTACAEETALLIQQLVRKIGAPPGVPSGLQPKSKRVRDAETVWIRQLMCIPSISERVALLLLDHFGSLRALQDALEDLNSFPRIRLDARTCIGMARLRILARYLT